MKKIMVSLLVCFLGVAVYAADNPRLSAISLSSASVVGGNSLRGTVALDKPAPVDMEVSLAADPTGMAKVPTSVTVPAGSTTASFIITTRMQKTIVGGEDTKITIYGNQGVTKNASFITLAPVSFDRMVDRVVERERSYVGNIRKLHPLAETYIQNLREDRDHNIAPVSDQYFLGRLDLRSGPDDQLFRE